MKNETLLISRNELTTELAFSGSDISVIELLPIGGVFGHDGRNWTLNDPAAVIEATNRRQNGVDLFIDFNHQSEYAKENGRPAPAGGWIKELFILNDKICARVEWTNKGATAINNKEFRYISPVFRYAKDGQILSIVSATLTNTPNLDLKAINQKQENTMDEENKALCQALGVSDQKQALDRVLALQNAEKALNEIASTLKCDATKEAVLKASNEPKADPSKHVELGKFTALLSEFETLKADREEEKALNAVESAVKAGKLPPALKENALEVYKKLGEKALNELVAKMPSVSVTLPAGSPPPAEPFAKSSLSDEEKATCQMLGISEETFMKGIN